MRKQTKLVAVLSAAALLAIGASMTSFAAGWTQEDGTWVYLDRDGDRVYDAWKKSGTNYYYLNDDGEMATNAVIEYDGEKYYVDAGGAKVTNKWISVDNEDDETIGDNDDISVIWYYFGSTGKAYKDAVKTVNGKKYIFDDNGYMLSGWQTYGDKEDLYYLGNENEGWAYTGWQYLEPEESEDAYDDEEWFYFKPSNGKAYKNERKYINGKYYTFDENGIMQDKWVVGTPGAPDYSIGTDTNAHYKADDGAQQTGWVYTYATDDPDEEGDEYWFYLDSKGVPFNYEGKDANAASTAVKKDNENWKKAIKGVAAKVIKSKTYLFNNDGEMQTGVFILGWDFDENGDLKKTASVKRTGSSSSLDGVYYFSKESGSGQGAMATGKTSVNYDGDTYNYYFQKDGSAYVACIADGALYDGLGERVDAEDGNTYSLVRTDAEISIKGSSTKVPADSVLIVNSNGKVKKSGTVKIDGYKYTVDGYVVKDIEPVD